MSDLAPDFTGDALLAAEYALGLLSEVEARAASVRADRDADFAAVIEWWRDRLQTLDAEPVAPPPRLWPLIEMRLSGSRVVASRLENTGMAANDDEASGAATLLRRWRLATGVMSAIAAALVGFIVLRPMPEGPKVSVTLPRQSPEPIVATLMGKRGDVITIVYDRATDVLLVTPAVLKPGKGDVELWIIPAGAAKPVAIGVIDARTPSRRSIDRQRSALVVEGATFAVSLEPRGGSPTGQPTGQVVATGKILRV